MSGIHDFTLFVTSSLLLNITPGPDTFYILGRGMAQGRGALGGGLFVAPGCGWR